MFFEYRFNLRPLFCLLWLTAFADCQHGSSAADPDSPAAVDLSGPQSSADLAPEQWRPERVAGWHPLTLPNSLSSLFAVWGTAQDDVWSGGRDGALLHFDGTGWSKVASPTSFCIRSIRGSGRRDVWAVATAECPLFSDRSDSVKSEIWHFDGTSWVRIMGQRGELTAIAVSGPSDAWAVGADLSNGYMMRFDGGRWAEYPIVLEHVPTALWKQAPDDVWMVSSHVGSGPYAERIQHWDGASWKGVPPLGDWKYGLWGFGPQDIWSVGYAGKVSRWNGTAWTTFATVGTDSTRLYSIWGSSPSDVWIAGDGILGHWDGASWERPNVLTRGRAIWGSSSGDVWLVSENGMMHYYSASAL